MVNTDWHKIVLAKIVTNCDDKPQRLLEEARRSAESRVLVAVGERSVTHGNHANKKASEGSEII